MKNSAPAPSRAPAAVLNNAPEAEELPAPAPLSPALRLSLRLSLFAKLTETHLL